MAKMQTKGYFMPDNIALEACNSTMKKFFLPHNFTVTKARLLHCK